MCVCVSPTVTLGRQEELGGHDPGKRRLAASAGGRPVLGPRSRGKNSYARSQTASQTFCWRGRQTVTQTRVPELHARRMRAVSCCLACRHARAERGRTPARAYRTRASQSAVGCLIRHWRETKALRPCKVQKVQKIRRASGPLAC